MASITTRDPDQPWWVHIQTTVPACQYYFGPFASLEEAEAHQPGYVEDLVREHALEVVVKIGRCQPEVLTLCDEADLYPASSLDLSPFERPTILSYY